MKIDFKDFVSYDETSPTFLRWEVDVYSGKNYKILEMAKDGDRFNNNISNLRLTTRQGNARNCIKRKDNTSGVTGVNLLVNRYKSGNVIKYWCGAYFENGKNVVKRFLIAKFGEDEALRLAIEFRLSKEKELNKVGVPFTERHGK